MNDNQVEKLLKLLWGKLFGETEIDEGSVVYNMVIRPLLTIHKMLANAAVSLYDPDTINDTQFKKHAAAINGISYSRTGYSAEVVLHTDIDMLHINKGDQFITEDGLILTASFPQTLSGPKTVIDGKPGYIVKCESPVLPELPIKISSWPEHLPITGGAAIQQIAGGNEYIDLNLSINDALLSREPVKALMPQVREIGILEAGSKFASDIKSIQASDEIYQGFRHKIHGDTRFNKNDIHIKIDIGQMPAPADAFDPTLEISTDDYYYIAYLDNIPFITDPTSIDLTYGSLDADGIPSGWIGGLHGMPKGALITGHEIRVYEGKLVLGYRKLDNNDWSDWDKMREKIENVLIDPNEASNIKYDIIETVKQFTEIDDAKIDAMTREIKSKILSKIRKSLMKISK